MCGALLFGAVSGCGDRQTPLDAGMEAVSAPFGPGRDLAAMLHGEAVAAYDRGDFQSALVLFTRSSELGHENAASYVGLMLARGEGTFVDTESALGWMRLAASLGDGAALNNFGTVKLGQANSEMLDGSLEDADRLYREAATALSRAVDAGAGEPSAMYQLGRLYEEGRGVERRDVVRARLLYELAAEQDQPDAMYRLGLMYESGQPEAAKRWLCAAAAADYPAAVSRLERFDDPACQVR